MIVKDANLVDDVQSVRPIEVEQAIEDDGVPIEVELVLSETVSVR